MKTVKNSTEEIQIERRQEVIDYGPIRRLSKLLGRKCNDTDNTVPIPYQWLSFVTELATEELGLDGHPPRGSYLPEIDLPRRMFVGGSIQEHSPLLAGETAERISRVTDVSTKTGRSGPMVFVTIEHEIIQAEVLKLTERYNIVYLEKQAVSLPLQNEQNSSLPHDYIKKRMWLPTSVELFQFSALTNNTHRIHYDQAYATGIEGYPALVVHGPLVVAHLSALASEIHPGQRLKNLSFRGRAPLFVDQCVTLLAQNLSSGKVKLLAIRIDSEVALEAEAHFE